MIQVTILLVALAALGFWPLRRARDRRRQADRVSRRLAEAVRNRGAAHGGRLFHREEQPVATVVPFLPVRKA